MNFENLLETNLHMFDGGAADGGADGGTAAAGAGTETGEAKGTVPGRTHRGKSGGQNDGAEFSGIVTDTDNNPHDAGEGESLDARRKAYRELVESEKFKDI